MSLKTIEKVLESITANPDWNFLLLRHTHNKKSEKSEYTCREAEFGEREYLYSYLQKLRDGYLNDRFNKYESLVPYDGTCNNRYIYKMQKDHELLSENYSLLEQSIINADDSTPIDNFGANAYLFYRATNSVDNVKLITLRSPMTMLKNRYHFREGAFHPIENKVLNLYSYIDLIVVDNTIYFMSMNGENLFNMERAYKKICNAHVELI